MMTTLEHLRDTAELTQRELASLAGITQETLSQLETGKSTRPRLDTLTKLRDALELGDMRPEDLLDPTPLDADEELAPAVGQLINLLKVLPRYDHRSRTSTSDRFWDEFCVHLGYRDHYPAVKIATHLDQASTRTGRATDLAQYALMFFDPADETALRLLAERGRIGPQVTVARLWCRDVVEAAWTLHRASMTSYPQQVGQLYVEAGEEANPERIAELCHSVYHMIRARAFVHSPVDEQIRALREDPADDVLYDVANAAGPEVQDVAVTIPRAWPGLAGNADLHPVEALVTSVLDELHGPNQEHAHNALLTLTDRDDLPRPLVQRISEAIDRREVIDNNKNTPILSAVLNVRGSLHRLDQDQQHAEDEAHTRRERFRVVDTAERPRPSWLRRFLQ